MGYRLVIANAQKPDSARDNALTVAEVADHADLAGLNEANDAAVQTAMRKAPGFRVWIPKGGAEQNSMMWREGVVDLAPRDTTKIIDGGRIGLSRVLPRRFRRDRRRLGPNHYAVTGVATDLDGVNQLLERRVARPVAHEQCSHIFTLYHGTARTQTSERWRWPVMVAQIRNLRRHNARQERANPGMPHLVAGDTNLRKLPRVFLGRGWREIKLPPDLGGMHYTRVLVKSPKGAPRKLVIEQPRRFRTKSDHYAESVDVRFGGLS